MRRCGLNNRSQRGLALIIVLWAVVGLSTVAASVIGTGRDDVVLAGNLRAAAVAEAAADGAIHRAGLHLLPCAPGAACDAWPANGRRIEAGSGGTAVGVCVSDESGRINPNTAGPDLLAALLGAVGIEREQAARLGAAIAQWRTAGPPETLRPLAAAYRDAGMPFAPNGQRFAAPEDLRFVLGMTPAILARLAPNLSVWATGNPDPALAPPAVRVALASLGSSPDAIAMALSGASRRTLRIVASVATAEGARFVRVATVRMGTEAGKAPMEVLAWSAGSEAECR